MKTKNLILIVFLFLGLTSFAQFRINSNGDIGIGIDPQNNTTLFLRSEKTFTDSRALVVRRALPDQSSFSFGTTTSIDEGGTPARLVGIFGNAYRGAIPYSFGRTTGIWGIAGNATSGYNYGVLGEIRGSNNGAAIFGIVPGYGETNVNGVWAGYFRGNVKIENTLWVNSTLYTSDINLKRDILPLDTETANKILELNAIKYKLDFSTILKSQQSDSTTISQDDFFSEDNTKFKRIRYGLSAQDVQKIFPEIVQVDEQGYLAIDYIELIPILIESIKELKHEITFLQKEINIESLKSSTIDKSSNGFTQNSNLEEPPRLYDNTPNPFNESTMIEFSLPNSITNANIFIYEMNGKQIKN